MNLPPLHWLRLAAPTSVEPDDGPVTLDDLGDDILGEILANVEDGDITELCKEASKWCLGMGMGRPVCTDPNDPQWERLCERVGWSEAATATPRRDPPRVGDEQFTWKKTFFSMCKALNSVNGTFSSPETLVGTDKLSLSPPMTKRLMFGS